MTREQIESVRIARMQLIDHNDSDLYECGRTQKEVDAACNAHERACEVIRQSKKEA